MSSVPRTPRDGSAATDLSGHNPPPKRNRFGWRDLKGPREVVITGEGLKRLGGPGRTVIMDKVGTTAYMEPTPVIVKARSGGWIEPPEGGSPAYVARHLKVRAGDWNPLARNVVPRGHVYLVSDTGEPDSSTLGLCPMEEVVGILTRVKGPESPAGTGSEGSGTPASPGQEGRASYRRKLYLPHWFAPSLGGVTALVILAVQYFASALSYGSLAVAAAIGALIGLSALVFEFLPFAVVTEYCLFLRDRHGSMMVERALDDDERFVHDGKRLYVEKADLSLEKLNVGRWTATNGSWRRLTGEVPFVRPRSAVQ
ncbi:hypothetical protein [Salininema proteolyticum]|uniref:Signal peptidase I n=1 Tax=Salininema proteolyticum TaxID=1607685 RepID=A0ABV8TWU7_9ACTN